MANSQPRCSVEYHNYNGTDLESQGHKTSNGVFGNNPPFTSPPTTKILFDPLVEDVHNTYEAFKEGGQAQKGAYLTARENLIAALDLLAKYVNELSGVNEAMIILAGFKPTKTGETQAVVPATPVIDKIERGSKGVLIPQCKPIKGASYYGCILLDKPMDTKLIFLNGMLAFDDGFDSNFILNLTKGRKKIYSGLESGKEYWFYFYAGNSAGVSTLSEGESIVCG